MTVPATSFSALALTGYTGKEQCREVATPTFLKSLVPEALVESVPASVMSTSHRISGPASSTIRDPIGREQAVAWGTRTGDRMSKE